jgi:hypothetical protein
MTKGLLYRFRVRAVNSFGFSKYSDVLKVGLGGLPSKPSAPIKSIND